MGKEGEVTAPGLKSSQLLRTAKEHKKLESFLNCSLGDLNLSQFSINSCLDYHEFWDNMAMSTASEQKNEVAPLCRKLTVPIFIFTSFSLGY